MSLVIRSYPKIPNGNDMTILTIAYDNMTNTNPKIAHVSCFFAASIFSALPLPIAMLNAVIPIERTANGAAK